MIRHDKEEILVAAGLPLDRPKTFVVSKVAIHPKYNQQTLENNIALIRLSTPISPSAGMRPICLPIHEGNMGHRTGTHEHHFPRATVANEFGLISSIGNTPPKSKC